MSRKSSKKGFVIGALVGGLCAGITALLFAPKKGSAMRKDIQKKCKDISYKTHELLDQAKCETEEMVEKAQNVIHEAKKVVNRIKRG